MNKFFILSLDQGTTGSRAFLFDSKGAIVASAYQEFPQYYPRPGWVEHDAQEIWESCVSVIRQSIRKAGIRPFQIAAIGITNQRETTVLWDRQSGIPLARAVVWQCRRSVSICERLRKQRYEPLFGRKTGLVLDPYFSGTKIKWLLDHDLKIRRRAAAGKVAFGTIDSWLIWKLTGGRAHVTDFTNASRTLIFDIQKRRWDLELLKILNIPLDLLPQVQFSGSVFGKTVRIAGLSEGIPITAVLGDQQAALYGQGCYTPGSVKNTYGTGCFMMLNTGDQLIRSRQGLLSTIAADGQGRPVYALEGAVFIAGALMQWLRDELQVIKRAADSQAIAVGLTDTLGVYFVPAFTGLGAPYWDPQARGIITGLTRGANVNHVIRAALESIAYQTRDVFALMQKEYGRKVSELRVDGGASNNDFLMQFQADILSCEILRPRMVETTAQGAALLAGVTMGLWSANKDLMRLQKIGRIFKPCMKIQERERLYSGWLHAVAQARYLHHEKSHD
jgi:glycerol kinase